MITKIWEGKYEFTGKPYYQGMLLMTSGRLKRTWKEVTMRCDSEVKARLELDAFIESVTETKQVKDALEFHILIKEERLKNRKTLDDAADKIGISKSHLWSIEQGGTEPRLRMLQKILMYYGLKFEQIEVI